MFNKKPEKQPQEVTGDANKKPPAELEGIVIHVMPEAFIGRKSEFKEKPKTVPVPKPVPIQKPPAKPAQIVQKPAPAKKSKTTLILVIIGVLVIAAFGVAGYLVVRSLNQEPVQVVETAPTVTETTTSETVEPPEPAPGTDTDSDGLSDAEERLYGTQARNPDTDSDTFLDGNEVFHRYSPLGDAPATLLDTGAVDLYTADGGEFTFTYPSVWRVNDSIDESGTTTSVVVTTDSLAVFSIDYFELTSDQTFEDWYQENGDQTLRFNGLKQTLTKEGYGAYVGRDDRIEYLVIESKIYTFEYDLGSELSIDYLQTFQMMINSFMVSD